MRATDLGERAGSAPDFASGALPAVVAQAARNGAKIAPMASWLTRQRRAPKRARTGDIPNMNTP